MRTAKRNHRPRLVALIGLAVTWIGGIFVPVPPVAGGYPVLPVGLSTQFLSNLSIGALPPGGDGILGFDVSNPLATEIRNVTLRFEVYAFNAFPGNSTGSPAPGSSPTLSAGNASASSLILYVGALASGASYSTPIVVTVPPGSADGVYPVRTALSFTSNGSRYLLESRGFFSNSAWQNATQEPNRTPTLNFTRLGVSGVLPETAIPVRTDAVAWGLYGLLAVALALAALGGYWAVRRGPASSSGARPEAGASHAPRALGKRRSNDGD